MNTRTTARLVLLNDKRQILLMGVEDDAIQESGYSRAGVLKWFTIGGRQKPGESLETTAKREAQEETGLSNIRLGNAIWHGNITLDVVGKPTLFDETFFVAHTTDSNLSASGWTEHEKKVIKRLKWWSLSELQTTKEDVFPLVLPEILEPILDGVYPLEPISIAL